MGKITKIEEQKRKSRVNLYIDGEFSCGLYKDTVVKYHLYKGKEITKAELSSIQEFEELVRAKEKTRNYLSYRPRSKREVQVYLKDKGFNKDVFEEVTRDFEEAGLINDQRFAEMWVIDRNRRNPKGHFALRMELKQKGINNADIEKTLKLVDERENARRAAEKAIKKYRGKDKKERKILAYLARRGFPSLLAREVLEEILRGE